MTKIAFIGGGSVQWTPILVADIALTETLAGATLVLREPALAALTTDPLIQDPATVVPMAEALLAAQAEFIQP